MPARKPVRRAQLISPFGVGAITNFPRDESLMVAGLDAWPFAGGLSARLAGQRGAFAEQTSRGSSQAAAGTPGSR